MTAGRLIVFEGVEGVGKSTQISLLVDRLAATRVPCVTLREPGGTPLGDEIRRLLLDPARADDITPRAEALLFMASRAQLVESEIRPALAAGNVVVLDRFFLSTYAYQAGGRGLGEEEVRAANRFATGGLVPDLTLLLEMPVGDGLSRAAARAGGRDRMERAEDEFHRRVAAAFSRFADEAWQRAHPECGPIARVDARGSEEDVAGRVLNALAARWPETFAPLVRSHLETGAR
jgi:dTMP kinase